MKIGTMPPKTMWGVKQEANVLDIYLYDDIQGDDYDYWAGEKIESETSANHVKNLLESAGGIQAINIYINSYGGEVKEGLGIYNLLKRHKAYKTAYIDGFACSIASVIAMAADKIIMGTNTLMMIHHAAMFEYGNSTELRKAANDLDVIDQASCSSYLEKAGDKLTEKTLNKLLDAQTWLSAQNCIKYGLADEITGEKDMDKAKESLDHVNQSLTQQIKYNQELETVIKEFAETAKQGRQWSYERIKQQEPEPAPESKPEQKKPEPNPEQQNKTKENVPVKMLQVLLNLKEAK